MEPGRTLDMATKRRLHVTKANAQNGARSVFWPEFRKVETIHARYIGGAFTVETREGVLDMPDGGWLALDRDGYPYPIATDVFERIYEEVMRCCRLHGSHGQHEVGCPAALNQERP